MDGYDKRVHAITAAHRRAEVEQRNFVVWWDSCHTANGTPIYIVLPEHHTALDLGAFDIGGFMPILTVKPWPH